MTRTRTSWVLGIDVGGTFTDIVALGDAGEIEAAKVPSTPDQSDGVMSAITKVAGRRGAGLAEFLAATRLIVHGTTVATNALLEYKGAKVGLVTTAGFRDEIEFRRSYKESVFDPRLEPPHAIVPRRLRKGVPERLDHRGEVLTPLDEAACRAALGELRDESVEAVAVCLLFSFVNPAHEARIGALIDEELPGVFVSLSSQVLPEIREFERVSTTVVNAYVGPPIQRYLDHLAGRLRDRGFSGELFVMQSNGAVQLASEAGRFAVNALLSGPAGGVTAGAWVGERANHPNLITVDMGGTSYDVAVIRNLQPGVTTETWIGRYRVALPMLDIHTVGAGGGSIARVDEGGALLVGPQSAGSTPGPACYGRGGARPTVTDADVLLGFVDPDSFLGGEMRLDKARAEAAITGDIATPLGMDPFEAALAIFDIVNANMANAIHFVTTKRGHDPRDFALLAAGGAGAIHAGRQAEDLGIETVVVPILGPVFCALGDDMAHLEADEARTHYAPLKHLDLDGVNAVFQEMETAARTRLAGQSVTRSFETRRSMDMRYAGEVHEVTVPVRSRTHRITALNVEATLSDFHALHERLYAHMDRAQPVELLTLRLELVGLRERPRIPEEPFEGEDAGHARKGERSVYFSARPTTVPVYDGPLLRPGNFMAGPAIIEQWGTTIVVYPGHEALIDAFRNCVIEVRREDRTDRAAP